MFDVFLKNNTEYFYSDFVELICDVVAENILVFILNFDFLFLSMRLDQLCYMDHKWIIRSCDSAARTGTIGNI